ncbi:MAG: tRNA (adenosine(37)-N6)-threonylcarbamoyltransferase complex dimerization subunit type 1 TsaB [Actinomycetota bacterium]
MTPAPTTGPGLAVTSSTGVMSLAVGRVGPDATGEPVAIELATERRHAEELGPQMVQLLERAGLTMSDLTWLAVDVGPGRFTGLRVGLATIRGLAFALDIPVVGLTSLEILAAGAGAGPPADTVDAGAAGPVTAVIDARRKEVFQQVFVDGEPAGPPSVGLPEDLATAAQGTVLGDGLDRYPEPYQDRGDAGLRLLPGHNPRAADLLTLGAGRTPRPGVEVGPLYLRDPDAKANIRTRPQAVTP